MQPRLAALLFALGLVDVAYVNLGLGHEVFADAAPQPSFERTPPAVEKAAPVAREPSPPVVEPEGGDPEGAQRAPGQPGTDLTLGFPDKATALLSRRARDELLGLAARLREHPEYRVHIVGHADARGSREFNLDLGGRRARAVTELLARAGVPRRQIEAESRGEDEPRAVGTSERVWAANRRVEITLGNDRSETP